MNGLYNVGAYIRLSIEDSAYDSESVENQREMLSKFIGMMPNWIEHKFYIDNGFSGATFERPAFQDMMADVRSKRVNLVLVKDLSRFGRNYLETGKYLEEELPSLGCRFIALVDSIDTENGESDIIPFLNMINDYYIKNLSDRIRSVMAAKARDGQKITGYAPYGFWRNPDDHTRLIVDDYAANIVRRIFEMRAKGVGYPTIAKTLNTDNILPPKLYYLEKMGMDYSDIKTRRWIVSTVSMILKREIYIGVAEQLKKTVISHRNKKEINRPKNERIRVENAFPVIIDRETWDAVQEVNRTARESCSNRAAADKSVFSGLVVCADCGMTLNFKKFSKEYASGKRISYTNAQCRTFQATGGTSCSAHAISGNMLNKLVLNHLRKMAEQITLDEDAMRNSFRRRLTAETAGTKFNAKKEIKTLGAEIHKLEIATAQLYEDWADDIVSEETFTDMMGRNETARQAKEQRLALLEQSEQNAAEKEKDIECWLRLVRKYSVVDIIEREMLESLVERIEISEKYIEDGQKHQDIRVFYKFVGLC